MSNKKDQSSIINNESSSTVQENYLTIDKELFKSEKPTKLIGIIDIIDITTNKFSQREKLKDHLFTIFQYSAGVLALTTIIGGVVQALVLAKINFIFVQYISYEQVFSYGLLTLTICLLIFIVYKYFKSYTYSKKLETVFNKAIEKKLLIRNGELFFIVVIATLFLVILLVLFYLSNFHYDSKFFLVLLCNIFLVSSVLMLNSAAHKFEIYLKENPKIYGKTKHFRKIRSFRYVCLVFLSFILLMIFNSTTSIFNQTDDIYNKIASQCIDRYYKEYKMVDTSYYNSNYIFIKVKRYNNEKVIPLKLDSLKYCAN